MVLDRDTVTYTAAVAEGSDSVTVQVSVSGTLIGAASAEITVDEDPETVYGSLRYVTEDVGGGSTCVSAVIAVPDVAGATRYRLNGGLTSNRTESVHKR